MSSLDLGDFEAQIRSLIEEKSRLLQELNEFHLQLRDKQTLEQQLELVSQECATVKSRYKSEQLSHNRVLSEMQGRLQQLSFEKTKLEDQLTVKTAASGGGEVATSMLSDMQSKYSATMDSLKEQLVERARENEELKRINITLVSVDIIIYLAKCTQSCCACINISVSEIIIVFIHSLSHSLFRVRRWWN